MCIVCMATIVFYACKAVCIWCMIRGGKGGMKRSERYIACNQSSAVLDSLVEDDRVVVW